MPIKGPGWNFSWSGSLSSGLMLKVVSIWDVVAVLEPQNQTCTDGGMNAANAQNWPKLTL